MISEAVQPSLPAEPNVFVGRERELAELKRLLRVTRALTLCGAGGIGKTRLALRLINGLSREFPDGVWLVELGDLRQPDLVVPRIAAAVGVAEEPGRPLLETLAEAVRPRRMLLVLDNCEHLIDVCAGITQRLLASAPELRVIATSREPLRIPAETVFGVPTLSVAPPAAAGDAGQAQRYEAVQLFAARAGTSLPGFEVGPGNAAAVAALCRALDGMPLAIELAAARVRALTVEQIADRLTDRFSLLTSGQRTAPPRQRTLRAAIDWSHELLTPAERVLLRRLSVFAGWSLEMAEKVCSDAQIPAADMLDTVAALVDKSLVAVERPVLGQARYRLLDSIREYAAERLAEAGEAAAFQRRLREYVIAAAERNFQVGMALIPAPWSARVDVFRRYDADADNVWQVLSACLADGDVESGLRICTAVGPCWIVRGIFAEAAEWVDAFLAREAPGVPAAVRGAALVERAELALPSDPAGALSCAQAGLELCRAAGDRYWTAAGLNLLAAVALRTGQVEQVAVAAQEALAIAEGAGDGWNEGYALGMRAAVAGLLGRLREAQELTRASIAVMRRIDQQWGAARGLLGLGDLARMRGDPGDARQRYAEALGILREVDAKPEIARCLAGLARVALELGDTGPARAHLAESLRLSHSTGARIGVARGLEAFAALAVAEQRPELAVTLTAAASALREAAGLPPLPGARMERYLAPGRRLGDLAFGRLWSQGRAMSSDAAVALALAGPPRTGGHAPVPSAADGYQVPTSAPSPLTPREREIAALVARGSSNQAIADELVISPATVARHIANIFGKLGFSSRAQIAAWAADNGLPGTSPA